MPSTILAAPLFPKWLGFAVRGDVRADALGTGVQVHVGRFWGPLGWDTFLVSDLGVGDRFWTPLTELSRSPWSH